jgi:hypothetical protein
MKSLLPSFESDLHSSCKTEHIALNYTEETSGESKILISDAYLWTAPDNTTICTALVLPCPNCEYPIIIRPDQFALNFDRNGITLNQKVSCPSRWKRMEGTLVESDEEGNPIIIRCGWSCKGIENSRVRNNKHGQT